MRVVYVSEAKEKRWVLRELEKLGHSVALSDPSMSGVETAPDVIFVDLSEDALPPAVDYWRQQGVPVLGVVKNGVQANVLEKLDDFLLEGASKDEIAVRLEVARRKTGHAPGEVIKADGLVINVASYEVTVDGNLIDLTYKEFELLKFLATNIGRVLTRDVLLDRVWGYDYFGGTRTVDVHIRRLRAKLGRYESLIETVRNVGYRFKK